MISCEKKKIKWATKLALKKEKMEKGKKREEERKIKIILEESPKVVLYACANQKATNYIQLSAKPAFSTHSHAIELAKTVP